MWLDLKWRIELMWIWWIVVRCENWKCVCWWLNENVWYNEVIIYDNLLNINEMFIYIVDVNEDVYIMAMNKVKIICYEMIINCITMKTKWRDIVVWRWSLWSWCDKHDDVIMIIWRCWCDIHDDVDVINMTMWLWWWWWYKEVVDV